MKKTIGKIISIIPIISLFSCVNDTKQRIYRMDTKEKITEDTSLTVTRNLEEERFVIEYLDTDIKETNYFSFVFGTEKLRPEVIPTYFTYSNSKQETLIFNELNYYYFYGSETFYVSFENSPKDIKDNIINKTFDIEVCGKTFVYDIYNRD